MPYEKAAVDGQEETGLYRITSRCMWASRVRLRTSVLPSPNAEKPLTTLVPALS